MKITRNNYEAYFIDYLEGNLDETLVDDFLEFLRENQDLKEELALFNPVAIEPEEITFSNKKSLYKSKFDAESEFNRAAIAQMEGDISETEKEEFEKYLSAHPEKEKEVLLFAKTRLLPDESVLFPSKNKLYKPTTGRKVLMWGMRIAAVLLLALAIYSVLDQSPENKFPELNVAELKSESNTNPAIISEPVAKQTENQNQEKTQIAESKAFVGKVELKSNQEKHIQKEPEIPLESNDLTVNRVFAEVPEKLSARNTGLIKSVPQSKLADIKTLTPPNQPDYTEERLLAEAFAEKTGLDKLSLNKITKAGLNLVSSLSKEKFQYETNEDGKVVEYSYESRLLAFSIPVKSAPQGE